MSERSLVWIRNDLRIIDNPAIVDAVEHGATELCFVVSEAQWRSHAVGERRLGLIHHALHGFASDVAKLGLVLHILNVPWFRDVPRALMHLVKQQAITRLVYNAEYPLNEVQRDTKVTQAAQAAGLQVTKFHGSVTLPPGTVMSGEGRAYKAFSPFKKLWLKTVAAIGHSPLPKPEPLAAALKPQSSPLLLGYANQIDPSIWPVNHATAQQRLFEFVDEKIEDYHTKRDLPGIDGTSRLSAALSLGLISANQCLERAKILGTAGDAWTNELIWREFYKHVTALFPHVSRGQAFKPAMQDFAWREAPEELLAWQAGETGYPLVDAAMRQLTETGWMHNRLRMVTAMFLTKHLLLDWRHGERFFMQQLIDGDFAANNGGWQWSASTGTDSVPYFRIFNPTTQGRKFDPRGSFTRKFLPALADVPDRYLYAPHESGLQIEYPLPIVEHKFARQRALDAFKV